MRGKRFTRLTGKDGALKGTAQNRSERSYAEGADETEAGTGEADAGADEAARRAL